MKKLIVAIVFIVSGGCRHEEPAPTQPTQQQDPGDQQMDPGTGGDTDVEELAGVFMSANGEDVTGTAQISSANLELVDFETNNGPDLKVYISTDLDASNYIRLGPLKATTGPQSYALPGPVDFSLYKYVLIWCESYSVLFGYAELK